MAGSLEKMVASHPQAEAAETERARDLDTIQSGGVFAGRTPELPT
ncbi:hypothetical protein EV657_108121 [Rhodovulum visakhapatnamense]|uniref:Uncharacterized protein n=1 Tax=Rhodovulum visakhapatnamense TaxID=364297 RepID=A0A4R8FSU0_9RHOB|nr:hypothetical protein EV657_108121 [Rhodovulum visakhapatnamense]